MNNLLFGDAAFGYYETICGGSGATATADGADAVHTHMTNTRLTDPEVLEARYPVRLREFSIRRGSGGTGQHRGGDGAIRRIEFLRPLTLSILSQRRGPYPPYGLAGGQPGALGRNALQRAGGSQGELPALVQIEVQPGDVLTIETPGGGGFGPTAASSNRERLWRRRLRELRGRDCPGRAPIDQFLTCDRHIGGSINPQPHRVPADLDEGQRDLVAKLNPFPDLAAQH